jgi:hypothetical protein
MFEIMVLEQILQITHTYQPSLVTMTVTAYNGTTGVFQLFNATGGWCSCGTPVEPILLHTKLSKSKPHQTAIQQW